MTRRPSRRALERAQTSDRPTLIACKTTIGFGAPKKAGTSKAHGEPLGAEELAGAKAAYRLDATRPSRCPSTIRAAWAEAGRRGAPERKAWTERLAGRCPAETRAEFERRMQRHAARRALRARWPG